MISKGIYGCLFAMDIRDNDILGKSNSTVFHVCVLRVDIMSLRRSTLETFSNIIRIIKQLFNRTEETVYCLK